MYMTETINYDPTDECMHTSIEPFKDQSICGFAEAYSAVQEQTKEPVDLYIPEPQSFKAILTLPHKQREAWLKAYKSELKNLIDDNKTFIIERPRTGERVIPTKPVFRAKQTKDGFLEKLKVREVALGNLERRDDNEDTWSPGTSSSGVCMFLAQAAKMKRSPKQGHFIGAYLQA